MIQKYIGGWSAPSEDVVYHMDSSLRSQLDVIVHEIFKNYSPGGLLGLVRYVQHPSPRSATHQTDRTIIDECLDQLRNTCLHRIREAFDRERTITTTLQV